MRNASGLSRHSVLLPFYMKSFAVVMFCNLPPRGDVFFNEKKNWLLFEYWIKSSNKSWRFNNCKCNDLKHLCEVLNHRCHRLGLARWKVQIVPESSASNAIWTGYRQELKGILAHWYGNEQARNYNRGTRIAAAGPHQDWIMDSTISSHNNDLLSWPNCVFENKSIDRITNLPCPSTVATPVIISSEYSPLAGAISWEYRYRLMLIEHTREFNSPPGARRNK